MELIIKNIDLIPILKSSRVILIILNEEKDCSAPKGSRKGDLSENYDARKIGLEYTYILSINNFENRIDIEILNKLATGNLFSMTRVGARIPFHRYASAQAG